MDANAATVTEAGRTRAGGPVIRASADDLMELAAAAGPAGMQVAAVLVLRGGSRLGLDQVRDAIAERIRGVPRLRQRLLRTPPGCGRPVWVDDPGFDIRQHVRGVRSTAPGDERALLARTAETITQPLPPDRPLWAVSFVTGLAEGDAALIFAFHHVLADGVGGLAVLAELADGVTTAPPQQYPRPAPSRKDLFTEASTARLRALAHLPAGLRQLRGAVAELGPGSVGRPPPCSLNRPTGPHRALALARADLAAVRDAAHANGGTVNDVILTAVTGALRTVLRRRGESIGTVVISIPVSARRRASAAQLGNHVGVIPVALPVTGEPAWRLGQIAMITRSRKRTARGASAALLVPAFRFLASLRVLHWLTDHQPLITTFVTNLPGPATPLSFLGVTISDVVAVATITGNVTVAFAVLSYAGRITVTVIADPDNCPDLPELARDLQRELDALTAGR